MEVGVICLGAIFERFKPLSGGSSHRLLLLLLEVSLLLLLLEPLLLLPLLSLLSNNAVSLLLSKHCVNDRLLRFGNLFLLRVRPDNKG